MLPLPDRLTRPVDVLTRADAAAVVTPLVATISLTTTSGTGLVGVPNNRGEVLTLTLASVEFSTMVSVITGTASAVMAMPASSAVVQNNVRITFPQLGVRAKE